MKIIEPSVGLWKQGDDVKAHVAKCARVCYGKETGNDDVTINTLLKKHHWSMFRHESVYVIGEFTSRLSIALTRYDNNPYIDWTFHNKRKSSIFKDPDGSIHDIDAFSKKPVGTYRFNTKTWEKNDKGITWNGGLFEHKDNVLTGRYFGICNIWNHETDKGYMPKPKRIIPCVEVEISPDNWIMAVSADSTELLLLSCDYNIKWEQVSCLKGIRLEDVTPELDSKAYAELKNNKH